MTLIYLSFDKILGSLTTALIGKNLTNYSDKNPIHLDNHYSPLTIAFDVLKSLTDNQIIEEKLLVNQCRYLNSNEISIAFFPLIIYNYHNPEKLALIIDNYCNSKVNQDSIKVFAIIVNLILSQQLEFKKITPQIIVNLESKKEEIINYLHLIDKMINYHQPLIEVDKIFNDNFNQDSLAIYQSLYIFLCQPYPLENSLKRSAYFSQQSESTIILTGYLLGLYHGYLNIPYQLRRKQELQTKIKEIEKLTKKLVAQWQGKMDNE